MGKEKRMGPHDTMDVDFTQMHPRQEERERRK